MVSSIVIGEEIDPEPSSSESRALPQVDQSFQNLKASLRKEIIEEVKTLLERSQKELKMAIRSSNSENRHNTNDEILESPISATLTPTKTVRFENANTSVNVRNTHFWSTFAQNFGEILCSTDLPDLNFDMV